jgi:ribonuclease P protein component
MHRSTDFRRAVRSGERASASTLVVHAVALPGPGSALVGFVVSKSVGDAVARNLVKRRLRHAVRPLLSTLGPCLLVIRAKPAAATADFHRLARDLDRSMSRVAGASC